MRWTCVVTRFYYWILGINVDLSGSPSGCARRIPLVVVAFGVLSVWRKTSASVSTLFRVVLPQLPCFVDVIVELAGGVEDLVIKKSCYGLLNYF